MKVRTFLTPLAVLAVCAVSISVIDAQQNTKEQDLFKVYVEKFGPPGPEHTLLEPLAGTWRAECKLWTDPNQPAQVSEGTLVRKPVMGGRFIQEEFTGKMMDKPFQGTGQIGYDRAKQKYVTSWIDSMDTALHVSYGTYEPSTKTWTFTSEDKCPITGLPVKMRDTLRIISPNEEHMEMFKQLGQEKEMKTMEIRLTRKQ